MSPRSPRAFSFLEPNIERKQALAAYRSQRRHAKDRGIEWRFTFETWLEWWGADLARRGPRYEQLGMCRRADAGAYEPGNVYKGTPRQNGKDRRFSVPHKRAIAAQRAIEAARDAGEAVSKDDHRDFMTEDERELDEMFAPKSYSSTW